MFEHARGGPHFSRFIPDSLSESGAFYLARKICEYWRGRGYRVITTVQPIGGAGPNRDDFMIRSDMVNGMPQVHL